jgi:hypothetical protein
MDVSYYCGMSNSGRVGEWATGWRWNVGKRKVKAKERSQVTDVIYGKREGVFGMF